MPIYRELTDNEMAQADALVEKIDAIEDPIERQMVIRELSKAVFGDVSPEDAAANRKSAALSPLN